MTTYLFKPITKDLFTDWKKTLHGLQRTIQI